MQRTGYKQFADINIRGSMVRPTKRTKAYSSYQTKRLIKPENIVAFTDHLDIKICKEAPDHLL